MHLSSRHRRIVAATLVALGIVPIVLLVILIASMFVLPEMSRAIFNRFVPVGVDAPDNWALAMTRIVWSFVVCGSIGLSFVGFGWWLFRRSAVL